MLKKENSPVYDWIETDNKWDGYGFKLENIIKIDPIEVNGKLSLWDFDYKE